MMRSTCTMIAMTLFGPATASADETMRPDAANVPVSAEPAPAGQPPAPAGSAAPPPAHAPFAAFAPSPAPAPERPAAALQARAQRARFSGGRLVVEMLAGALVGSAVAYGTFEATGGEGFGSAMAALGANIAITPLVVWGTGRALGGEGTLGMTYLGGLCAFAGGSASPEDAALSLAIGSVFLPITSSVVFEMSSHFQSKRLATVANGLAVAPVFDNGGLAGVRAGLAFGF